MFWKPMTRVLVYDDVTVMTFSPTSTLMDNNCREELSALVQVGQQAMYTDLQYINTYRYRYWL